MHAYKQDKAFNDMPNEDDTEEDDSSSESLNLGQEWKNNKDVHYITDKELEIVLQKNIRRKYSVRFWLSKNLV